MATYKELRTRSQQVRDEQNIGGNTALRVGQLLMDIVKYFNDNDAAASEYLQQHFAMVNDGTHLLNWHQSPIVILHTMGETYDEGDFSALSKGENYYRAGFIMEANGKGGGGINGETPKANVLYVNLANDTLYTWNGASFDAITSGSGGGSISGDDIIKNAYYSNGNLVLIIETEGGDKTVTIPVTFDASNYVPTSRTVNGKRLNGNIVIGMSDIPGLGTAIGEAGKVKSVSVNNGTPAQPDSNGNVNIQVQTGSTISPASNAPSMDGTASVGSSAKYAREDHVHPHDTSKQDTLTFDNAPTAGSNNPVKSGGIKTAIDQVTPTIDANGKWVIGGVATDKDAQGPRGNSILVNENAQGIQALIVNNVSDGGETDILSAEMGKVIRQNIMRIFNALGTYAFPEGKPILNWGSTVINHSINVNGVTGGLTISDVEVDGTSVGSLPSQIADGKSLSLKLNLPVGMYVFDGVAITMDGVAITNNTGVWDESTGTIYIASVTGDISITAAAILDPINNYAEQSHLVFQLDGLHKGQTAGKWTDLKGGVVWDNHGAIELSDCWQFDGSSYLDSQNMVAHEPHTCTIEVVIDSGLTNKHYFVFTDGSKMVLYYYNNYQNQDIWASRGHTNSTGYGGITTSHLTSPDNGNGKKIVSVTGNSQDTVGGKVNGVSRIATSTNFGAGPKAIIGGLWNATNNELRMQFTGKVYAIRIYDTILSEADMLANQRLDNQRFNLGLTI